MRSAAGTIFVAECLSTESAATAQEFNSNKQTAINTVGILIIEKTVCKGKLHLFSRKRFVGG
jgi:hypothetical protein